MMCPEYLSWPDPLIRWTRICGCIKLMTSSSTSVRSLNWSGTSPGSMLFEIRFLSFFPDVHLVQTSPSSDVGDSTISNIWQLEQFCRLRFLSALTYSDSKSPAEGHFFSLLLELTSVEHDDDDDALLLTDDDLRLFLRLLSVDLKQLLCFPGRPFPLAGRPPGISRKGAPEMMEEIKRGYRMKTMYPLLVSCYKCDQSTVNTNDKRNVCILA